MKDKICFYKTIAAEEFDRLDSSVRDLIVKGLRPLGYTDIRHTEDGVWFYQTMVKYDIHNENS